jgi:hypothetical protein
MSRNDFENNAIYKSSEKDLKYKFFKVLASDSETGESLLNSFLAKFNVINVEKHIIANGDQSFWAICVAYLDKPVKVALAKKVSIFSDFWEFLKHSKRWWLLPIVVILVLLSALIVLTGDSAVFPMIYALF